MIKDFRRDFSQQAFMQGVIVALVGYASSVAVVVQGLRAMGATPGQIASGLFMMGVAKGVVAIGLSLWTRMPISIAWTTPGLALLAVTPAVTGGFPAAVGAFIAAAGLIVLTGLWPPLSRLIARIPKAIANAMLAGILFKLAIAPFVALQQMPLVAGAVLGTWVLMMKLNRLYAVPAAVAVAIGSIAWTGGGGFGGPVLPTPTLIMPDFTIDAMISIALPLYIVTMTSQNITGLAVLGTYDWRPDPRLGLAATGAASALTVPFGAATVNYAAITAAMCAGPDAHPERGRRYVAAVVAGVGYIGLSALAGLTTAFVVGSSPILIEAAAGLALIGAFASATAGALQEEQDRVPAMAALLMTASGLSLFGIGPAFWGLVIGCGLYAFFRLRIDPSLLRR
jgi:benzoate membrane transport protein